MSLNTNYIPKETSELVDQFAKLTFIKNFTLVGGTALALQLGHRQSEDLDFIFDGEKIPAITYTEPIIYTSDIPENSIENHLNPKEMVTKEQISDFFIEELKKLRVN